MALRAPVYAHHGVDAHAFVRIGEGFGERLDAGRRGDTAEVERGAFADSADGMVEIAAERSGGRGRVQVCQDLAYAGRKAIWVEELRELAVVIPGARLGKGRHQKGRAGLPIALSCRTAGLSSGESMNRAISLLPSGLLFAGERLSIRRGMSTGVC